MLKIRNAFFPKVQAGQDDLLGSFKKNYIEHQEFIRSSIYWMVNSSAVDDLVQETFLKAWKSYGKFEGKSSFKTWIYRIAMNVTYDFLKKNNVLINSRGNYTDKSLDSVEHKENVDLELSDLISKGLLELPKDKREAFSLRFQQGFSYSEIALLLNIPKGTVKSRVNGAKKNFVEFLEKNGVKYE